MEETFETMSGQMISRLRQRNITVEPDAFSPMRQISFSKLVDIHDHEELFLKNVFLESLIAVHGTRKLQGVGADRVSSQDVKAALLMLGAAAASADPAAFSRESHKVLASICPWC